MNADSLNVVVPKPTVECFKQSLCFVGAIAWNEIPTHVQSASSNSSFKNM